MKFEAARQQMLSQQVRTWDVLDTRVIETLRTTHREAFVPESERDLAFADIEIPLAHGQNMMTPKLEARLLQELDLKPTDRVLEVGTGSGYLAACLSRLAGSVVSLEIFDDLCEAADRNLTRAGIENIELWNKDALKADFDTGFDAIAVTASVPALTERFIDLLNPGGRLFIVVGRYPIMQAMLVDKHADGGRTENSLFETVLTPLINADSAQEFVL